MRAVILLLLGGVLAQTPVRRPDVIFLATEDPVIAAMLEIADVKSTDIVYDLGCGDGRIVIAAAQRMGARGVGIDIDPQRITEANANAKTARVTEKVQFSVGDIFADDTHIGDASVVMLYLLPSLNQRLKPKLFRELKPGTRIVSNSFDMGEDWPPEKTQRVGTFVVYLWTIPKR